MKEVNKQGTMHPLTLLAQEAYQVFSDMGFEIAVGPELESEWYNFSVLNVPKDHPARDMQDTFWVRDPECGCDTTNSATLGKNSSQRDPKYGCDTNKCYCDITNGATLGKNSSQYVLRTHTTSVTARAIEKAGKEGRMPCAFISIGKVFRNEATDATHEMQFYQIDGAMVGENISVADMKGVLTHFYKKMLGDEVEIEFRPSFFPFTEPSLEVHAKFNGRWLEMMGAGMLHPNVLRNVGLDPQKIQGFAFGGGLDRIAMVKWGISDVRFLYQGDLRLNQF